MASFIFLMVGKKLLIEQNYGLNDDFTEQLRIIKLLNYYRFSPTFLLFGGYCLHKKLIEKYGSNNKFGVKETIMALFTMIFCDILFIAGLFTMAVILMYKFWLPEVQIQAYNSGFNTIETDPFDFSCGPTKACIICNEVIQAYQMNNGTYKYWIEPDGGCNDQPPIYCPMVRETGIEAVKEALASGQSQYVDKNSFVNGTYITYIEFGKPQFSTWDPVICYRERLGEYYRDQATDDWIWNFVYVIGGEMGFIYLMNIAIYYLQKKMAEIDNEKVPIMSYVL